MTRLIDQEFAVVVAALLAGRIDGQQAIASLTAIHTAHLAAILADPETVEAVRAKVRTDAMDRFLTDYLADDARHWMAGFAARAAIAVIAGRLGCEVQA